MSKEEILDKKNWSSEYPNYMAEYNILDAMDEYAKCESISFAEWIEEEGYSLLVTKEWVNDADHYVGIDLEDSEKYTTSQLYSIYQSSKQKV